MATIGPVTTAGELQDAASASDGDIIWIDNNADIDLTGQDLYLEGGTLASGRGGEGAGGIIRTSDYGENSPVWDGGSNSRGLIELGDNARLSGLRIFGPHHSEQDHPAVPGYMPRAPSAQWRQDRYARGVSMWGNNNTIDNCEIAYFSVQGVGVGNPGPDAPENLVISHCYIHNCMMTSLGYPIDVRTGHPQIHRCYFDAYRHAINGSGYANAGYYVTECIFGPWLSSFPVDMHGVHDNTSGTSDRSAYNYRYRAGGTMVVRNCDFLGHTVPNLDFMGRAGQTSAHATVRAVPDDQFYFLNNRCTHSGPDSGVNQRGVPGSYDTDENGYTRITVRDNEWGVSFDTNVP